MKAHPILFSDPMVRAILEGRKTQTRRVIKPMHGGKIIAPGGVGIALEQCSESHISTVVCPYGLSGDRLWVREAWCSPEKNIVGYRSDACCGAFIGAGEGGMVFEPHGFIIDSPAYRECFKEPARTFGLMKYGGKWRPSIHMPRWASRILLEIVTVRVERLNDISRADAIAEGVEWNKCPTHQTRESMEAQRAAHRIGMAAHYEAEIDYIGGYRWLWESINGPGSWAVNPWVWVPEFKRVAP